MSRKIKNFSNYLSKFISEESIESIARTSGFKQRASTITAQSFLETVFFCNSSSSPSLSEYSIDLEHHSHDRVSKQAIDKRFNERTKKMLTSILQKVMSTQMGRKTITTMQKNYFTDIRIMDSSEFVVSKKASDRFPGYGGKGREAIVQIQFEYQLLDSKITELTIGSALDSDTKEGMKNIDKIPAKTLLLRDLGYFGPKVFKELSQKNLYFISRAKSQWNFYTTTDGKLNLLTTSDIIKKLKDQKEKYLDIDVYVGGQERSAVRLVANLLTAEQTAIRLKHKTSNRKLGKDTLESIGLNLFVTNVERDKCNASAIYELYTLRWQVELIFKTWKSVMQVHKIHAMNAIRLECIILVKLLWIMLNWSILNQLKSLTNTDISFHKLTHTLQCRSKKITINILQKKDLLYEWLIGLGEISIRYHQKEYKKGSNKMTEILKHTYIKAA